ncbi:sensor domain-containing diguanylate cyclase [Croceibacterium salegens]|uniref:sensor domain-containing diguanylate cyclase n=1 Tax=Croceibacterium salegens TaxID=1737568 RepID=UPI001914F921|nr:diguanylate cyclase [Croceibacterium salegens]
MPAAVLWALFAATPARPAPPPDSLATRDYCVATSDLAEPIASVVADPNRWNCRDRKVSLEPERTLLRFGIDRSKPLPRFLVTRRSPLENVRLLAIDADGAVRSAIYANEQLLPAQTGGFVKAPLPTIGPDTREVVAAFDLATHQVALHDAHIAPNDPGDHPGGRRLLLLLSALCGMLVLPLIFNAVFYRILRERFVLWHSALALSLLLTILVNSGLSTYIVDLAVPTLSKLTSLAFGLAVVAGAMFAYSFIEPGKLHPVLRRSLPWAACWALAISAGHAFFPFVAREVQTDLYYAGYLPILALLFWMVVDALRRGSRAAKFQLIGWLPMLAVGVIRELGQLTLLLQPTEAMMLFYFGCVFDIIATTLGVADRFMALKNQRDEAQTEARLLERLSERDSLTGLLNRRLIEERWDVLRSEGFSTLAIVDLDRFKQINDTHGHARGDEVLRAVAIALAPDRNTLAFRMGGEEFMLLLRGADTAGRAERRRQAIPTQVAAKVGGLDRMITASMGMVELPADAKMEGSFQSIYERADQLLYEAKQNGRNRTVGEKLTLFVPRARERRRRKQAAG